MKKDYKQIVLSFSIIIMALSASNSFADNPLIQIKLSADPAPMVYNDTVFFHNDHDENDVNVNFHMITYLLNTSTDMANWTDHGIIIALSAFSWADPKNGADRR
jgi:arabinoxylan arabinofuranohydrolase